MEPVTRPVVWSCMRLIERRMVVLPQPEGPSNAVTCVLRELQVDVAHRHLLGVLHLAVAHGQMFEGDRRSPRCRAVGSRSPDYRAWRVTYEAKVRATMLKSSTAARRTRAVAQATVWRCGSAWVPSE